MQNNTTGSYNSAFGVGSLGSNTTASNNTAVGYQAGYNNTGSYNVYDGYQAGYYMSSGSYNTAIGIGAMTGSATPANNTGGYNTAVGVNAMISLTSGSNNVAVGRDAGSTITTGGGGVYIGRGAGASTNLGNTMVGYLSGQNMTSPTENYGTTLVGFYSGNSIVGGNDNAFLGSYSGRFQTGNYNVAVGGGAMYGINGSSSGSGNTALGYSAGSAITTGTYNVSIGRFAGSAQSGGSGTDNTSIGNSAGSYISSGNYNTAVGSGALQNNTTASYNTAVGYQAGYSNTTGANNVFVGRLAGYAATTAQGNVFIGDGAGIAVTTGYANTFIGPNWSAGGSSGGLVTTGYKNTIIGAYTGNQNGLDIRTASNYVVLSDGDGAPRAYNDANTWRFGTTSDTNNHMVASASGNGSYLQTNHPSGASSGYSYHIFTYNSSTIGSITQSGTTAVLFNVTSDQRLKENIVDAPEFGSVIDSLQVRSFDWKTDHTHQRAGFIAQELVTVAPEAVHQPVNEEEMMAVDYSKLVPMLVKEIQDLRKRLAALEAK